MLPGSVFLIAEFDYAEGFFRVVCDTFLLNILMKAVEIKKGLMCPLERRQRKLIGIQASVTTSGL